MGSIAEIIDVQISIQDTSVERASFGFGLVVGSSGALVAKVEEFANAAAAAEVYTSGDPELKMIQQYFGQELKPTKVFAAQRDVDVAQEDKILISSVQDTTLYSVTISIDGATAIQHDFTSDGDATASEIVDGLVAAIAATSQGPLLNLTDNGDDFNIESATAGDPLTITVSVNLLKQSVTANRNIETELAAIEQVTNKWYALMSASHSDTDIKRAANFTQARRLIYGASTQNADVISPEQHVFTIDGDADFVTGNSIDLTIDGVPVTTTPFNSDHSTTLADLATNIQAHARVSVATVTGARQITVTAEPFDVLLVITALAVTGGATQAALTTSIVVDPTTDLGAQLKALTLDRTFLMYSANADSEFPESAWIGGRLPNDPGSQTWAFKQLSGVTVDTLTDSQKSKALGNNVNTYTEIGGVNITQNGTMASGRFIDTRRGTDALQADIEERVFFQIVNLKKIPFTNSGTAIVENEIRGSLQGFIDNDFLAADPAPTVFVPNVADISALDRADRLLPDVTFQANLSGAIHKVIVRGTVSV